MKLAFGLPGSRSELHEVAEFFGSAFLVAFVLHQSVRIFLPDRMFETHHRFLALLSFLIAISFCARAFEAIHRRWIR